MQHEIRAIEELVFVTKLSFVPAQKDKEEGFRATLSCALCRWYDSCGKGQEQTVQPSRECTTLFTFLQTTYRRCENTCKIVMVLGALKLLPKKLLLMPPQLLQ
jgi:hypothetical protein